MSSRSARAWSPLALSALALVLLAGFAALHGLPAPMVHDEFAYLLSADTFAHGRLTNPPHALAPFFETYHVLFEPTYQAKYPPGQGLLLALGQVLAHPIVGVWLSWAGALAALAWMLSALLPRAWALGGAALALFQPYLFLVWGESYWGGAVAAAGGALLFGGLLHAQRRARTLDGVALGAGVFLLGNSRPFEGLLASAFALGLFVLLARRRWLEGRWSEFARRNLVPLALGLALLLGWTMLYDWRVTGHPFELPYFRYHPELSLHQEIRSYTGSPERSFAGKALRLVEGLLGLPLFAALPFALRRRRDPFVLPAALAVYTLGVVVLVGTRAWPHYLAPVLCLLVFLAVLGLRELAALRWRERPVGRALAALLVLLHVGLWADGTLERITGGTQSWARDRVAMIASLEAKGGKHLVLVRYGPDQQRKKEWEWVYNEADIDAARVVWARDLGPERDRALFDYYPDRAVWTIEVPPYRPLLRRYDPAAQDEPESGGTAQRPGGGDDGFASR